MLDKGLGCVILRDAFDDHVQPVFTEGRDGASRITDGYDFPGIRKGKVECKPRDLRVRFETKVMISNT